jgi:hypothetical protein
VKPPPPPSAELEFPPEWMTAPWIFCTVVVTLREQATNKRAWIAGGVLEDGTNVLAMLFEGGGHRAMRAGPVTRWGIEERLGTPDIPKSLRGVWRQVIESSIKGQKAAQAELGPGSFPERGGR